MTEEITREQAYKLLTFCVELSPNGKVQRGFSTLYNNLQDNPPEYNQFLPVVKGLLNRLQDGLCYGNWPEVE